jgi:peptidoglycan/LPS O-acetylase OafA/YrhL
METIGSRLDAVRAPRGFDYVRIGLSICVLTSHSFDLADPIAAKIWTQTSPFAAFKLAILPMFFAVSGFLVTGSLVRARTISGFATLRVVRLLPALSMEVFLSALLLGPLVTTVALSDYFTDPLFRAYFFNLAGVPQYLLPGVFLDHPRPEVNGQLWTLPYELWCYGALALLGLAGLLRRPAMGLAILIGFTMTVWLLGLVTPAPRGPWLYSWSLVSAFAAGVVLFLYRHRLPWNARWGAASFALTALLYLSAHTRALAMIPIAYWTVWLGLFNPRATWIAGRHDYSYGVYLLAYPIQQLLWMWPAFRPWYMNMSFGLVLTLLAAAFSAHFVEQPAMRRRKVAVERVESIVATARARLGTLILNLTARVPRA